MKEKIYFPAILAILAILCLATVFMHFECRAAKPFESTPPIVVVPGEAVPAKSSIAPLARPAPVPVPAPAAKPGVALITATWCGPCRRLEKQVLPQLDASGLDILMVDVDVYPELTAKLIDPRDHGIPQFVRLGEKTAAGDVPALDWLIGYHDLAAIQKWIAASPSPPPAPSPAPRSLLPAPRPPSPARTGKTQASCAGRGTCAAGLRRVFSRLKP